MTKLKRMIMSIEEGKERYDNAMKLLLSDISILSRILASFVPEYRDISVEDIEEKYIDKNCVSVSMTGVADIFEEKTAAVFSAEDTGLHEADIYYDILFRTRYPWKDGEEIGLYINIEAQNSVYPGYPLEMRAVYYGARLLSSQLKTINKKTNYGSLKKVYSIWICTGSTVGDSGNASLYSIKKNDILKTDIISKKRTEDKAFYDLIGIIMLHINEETDIQEGTLRLLGILFSAKTSKMDKLRALESSGIKLEEKTEGALEDMCNLSEYVYQGGVEEGMEKGRIVGLAEGMAAGQERLNSLYIALMNEGKIEELKKVMHDRDLREEFYKIYGL